MVTVKIDEKRNLMMIELPMQPPTQSTSGKTLLIASTRGFASTTATLNGKPVSISINATIPR
jgi:hypothetical protein